MKDITKAIAIVEDMWAHGYALFGESAEHFAARFEYDAEVLDCFRKRYFEYKGIKG